MRLWNWACHKGSSVGSATTVANRDTKLAECWSGGKNTNAPTDMIAFPIDDPKTTEAIKNTNKKVSFNL